MKYISYFLFLLYVLLLLTNCGSSKQLPKIPHGIEYTITNGNVENAKPIQKGHIVKIRKSIYVGDSLSFKYDIGYPSYQLVRTKLESENAKDYISQILVHARTGDSISVSQPIDSLKLYAYVPSNKKGNIEIHIKILDVFDNITQAEKDKEKEKTLYIQKERQALRSALQQNNIDVVEIEGIFIEQGNNSSFDGQEQCAACNTYLRYEGKLLETNRTFDENFSAKEPLKINLEQQQFIKGFEIATRYTPTKETIKAYVPSMLAYKEAGSHASGIPPFQHLIFTIKVEKRTP